jgi:hypothetical protein
MALVARRGPRYQEVPKNLPLQIEFPTPRSRCPMQIDQRPPLELLRSLQREVINGDGCTTSGEMG